MTDLQFTLDIEKEMGYTVETLEDTWSTYVVAYKEGSSYASVKRFWTESGNRVKKLRHYRDIKETSKGKYVMVAKKRYYLGGQN